MNKPQLSPSSLIQGITAPDSFKQRLESDLQSVTNSILEKEVEVEEAKHVYNCSFTAAILLPLLLFILQLLATRDLMVWNPSLPSAWSTIKDTFSVTLGSFGIIAAITGMLGFNHRAKQLDLQQMRANKQTIMAELQFDLANRQFITSQRRENIKIYYEHIKIFEEELDRITTSLTNKHEEKPNVYLDKRRIYKNVFPENDPDEGVTCHDARWPHSLKGWEGNHYTSFSCFVKQIRSYKEKYPHLSNDQEDFDYEVSALIDVHNTLAEFGFSKILEKEKINNEDKQFKVIGDVIFMLYYLESIKVIKSYELAEALREISELFGGLFWPNHVHTRSIYRY
ncbi:hypothetical protein W04_3544 [Pseudoalteromonas sp. SW0106-04]|uniref:hypothetical protein n=1 Tax=Pseudoalteromonas sp. SW0106-04 TaxID=1702169 RepID=UPI0006C2B813|nr:hypothetical protein [Pseudoalteromonas sp. SW0106-04]GAP76965.1 hypothetical protein W04_3544 [Pseudoalteromonas sp. SW0106-04]